MFWKSGRAATNSCGTTRMAVARGSSMLRNKKPATPDVAGIEF